MEHGQTGQTHIKRQNMAPDDYLRKWIAISHCLFLINAFTCLILILYQPQKLDKVVIKL